IPLSDLAAALLTRPEFEGHCEAFGEYNVEDLRLNLDEFKSVAYALVTLLGPDGVLQQFPIRDPGLRRILQTVLDHHPEQYAALIHAALELSDYRDNHPEEQAVVSEDPIFLDDLLTVDEERARVGLAPEQITERPVERPKTSDVRSVPNLPARL